MELKIRRISLENFKGKRSLNIEMKDGVTCIYGANRTGKTTIADAITWCLFGKDSKGRTQFGIKTRDENGEEIPHLPHSVTMDVMIDGAAHTIQRTLVEQWTKMHGAAETTLRAHTTECYVDGQKYTVRDYQQFVANIVSEDTFRMLTTPTYFPSMAWEEQRRALVRMSEPISDKTIVEGLTAGGEISKEQGEELLSVLSQKSIIEHVEHLSYQMKQVKGTLAQIPIRIEEVERGKPNHPDMEEDEIKKKEEETRSLLQSLHPRTSLTLKPLTDRMTFLTKRKVNIEQGAENKVLLAEGDRDKARQQIERGIKSGEDNIKSLEKKIYALNVMIERVQGELELYYADREGIRESWKKNTAMRFELSETDDKCPTCGQPLPEDMLREHIGKMREDFNKRKATTFDWLTKQAETLKKNIAEAEQSIENYRAEKVKTEADIEQAKQALEELRAKAGEPEEPIPTKEQILAEDVNYQGILRDIATTQQQIDEMQDGDDEQRRKDAEEATDMLNWLIEGRQVWEAIKAAAMRIDELRESQRQGNMQLSMLERMYDAAMAFQMASDKMLEEQVNKMFKFVGFRLFKTLINGTRQPYCEAMVGGIPYSDLNRADQINAGIDIINTMTRHYGVYVPLVIDNAEAINDILPTETQNIQLYVSDEKELTIR